MDSYQPPHHHYMRPPPPPPPQAPPPMAADPHFSHHHPPPPPPPSNSWFSGQFQYHPSHSPSPPPPPPQQNQQQNQWGPPPPLPPPPPYPAHPHQPYPAQPYPPPPPPSQPPPPPPPYSHQFARVPLYPSGAGHQDWTNANWSHHSAWEYQAPAHGNEEDWAAKARAWASARSAVDNQHPPQTQFTSVARQEEPSHYANQYAQPVESHYQDVQQTSIPTSSFQNYQGPVAPLSRPPIVHQQEPASISSYASDAHFSFATEDATPCGDMNAAFPRHQVSTSSFVHQQEVPSSYYSVPGKEDGSQGYQHGHSLLPNDGRSIPMNHAQFAYGNHPPDPMDQPLDFVPRYSHENDPKMNFNYPDSSGPVRAMDSVSAVSSLHSWTSQVAPGESYPPMTPAFPSATQHDPSIGLPPLPGQPVPMFGRGPSFQPAVPSITAPVGLGTTSSLHPTAAFPTDTYGASLGSERPKKAAVPNWLREEIIKNKATITTSVPEPSKEESQSNEDEIIGKSTAKGDQADSKSMDSARSPEEEDDDDEDYEEAQKTAAMNREIKRVLTEVLLKVTDDLFDEIATKVLSEDDLDADAVAKAENHVSVLKSSPPHPPVPALQASAKVLIPVKPKESDGHASGESSSGTIGAGNVLGLANYASDDEDEIQTSGVSKSDTAVYDVTENGHRQHEAEDRRNIVVAADAHHSNGSSTGVEGDHVPSASKLHDLRTTKDLDNVVQQASSRSSMFLGKRSDGTVADEQSVVKSDAARSTDNDRKEDFSQPDVPNEKEISRKSYKDDSQERDAKRRDRHESRRSSSGRDNDKEKKSGKEREAEKEETLGRQDEKRQKKDKTVDNNISREKSKELDGKHGEKVRESDSRRRSPHREDKDSKKERERDKKRSGKDDVDKKRETTKDEKGDKSRHKSSSDASRHKRRRSSSVGSRDRKNEDSTAAPDVSDAETSDDSKRKVHSKRRNLSPSPVRSRRRQVSRSPHSKHSQRRHSPYSSLDDSRGKRSRARSRSRSPVRRRK